MFIYFKKRDWLQRPRRDITYNIVIRAGTRKIKKLGCLTLQPHRTITLDFTLLLKCLAKGVKFSKNFNDLFYHHAGHSFSPEKRIIRGIF